LVSLTPHWLPTGWFQVGWSDDVPVGEVRPLRFFGDEQVAFRDTDGKLHILDAHCRHLGGHLGFGGRVEGDCVVCPFHGWHWNGDGRNTHIPYQPDRPNKARRIRLWPVYERSGVVYVWHDVEASEPSWDPPDIFTDTAEHTGELEYHPAAPHGLIRYGALSLHPQLVLENAADPIHFRYVHGTKHHPVFLRRWEDDAHWFSQIGFGSRWQEMVPDSHDGDTLSILAAGVGLSYTSLSGSSNTLILLSTTPIDANTSEMFQTVWLEKLPDDTPDMLKSRMDAATAQLPNDISIWVHQRFEDPPALATVEGRAYRDLRLWARRFYPELAAAPRLQSAGG
jgi:3-ketosteroid 9alpha-monooxygenase subunit A